MSYCRVWCIAQFRHVTDRGIAANASNREGAQKCLDGLVGGTNFGAFRSCVQEHLPERKYPDVDQAPACGLIAIPRSTIGMSGGEVISPPFNALVAPVPP